MFIDKKIMTKKEVQKHLSALFTTVKVQDTGEERICFDRAYLSAPDGSDEKNVQEIVSSVMFESGLTHDFSYDIASSACDVLANADELTGDMHHELIDSHVPIYYHDISKIYLANWGAVDEYREEVGGGTPADSMKDAQGAWYMLIENMVREIGEKLAKLVEDNEAGV